MQHATWPGIKGLALRTHDSLAVEQSHSTERFMVTILHLDISSHRLESEALTFGILSNGFFFVGFLNLVLSVCTLFCLPQKCWPLRGSLASDSFIRMKY